MHDGKAVKLREVEFNGGASLPVSVEPVKPEPVLLDMHGDVLKRTNTWMSRLDAKTGEDVTLKKGTIALIALGFVLLQVIFNYGGSMFGWVRNDESQKLEIQQLRSDVTDIKKAVEKMQDDAQKQAVTDAVKRGYELKAAEGNHGQKEK